LQEQLFQEMKARIKETDSSVPEQVDQYLYYTRTEDGKQYDIHCRKKGTLEASEEVILDENQLANEHTYFSLGAFEISPDHNLLAYSTDTKGTERFTIFIKDLRTGEHTRDCIIDTVNSLEWGEDGETIFYTVPNEAWRPYKLYRHILGNDLADDELVWHEENESFSVNISKAKSRKYLFMTLQSEITTEVHYLEANLPHTNFSIIYPRDYGVEYYVGHGGEFFYIRTNKEAENFKIIRVPVNNFSVIEEIVPYRKEVMLQHVEVFADHLVLYEQENGLPAISILNFSTGEVHRIDFPEPAYSIYRAHNPMFNTKILRFMYSSLVTPETVIDYNMMDNTRKVKKEQEIPSGYDKTKYVMERIFASSHDRKKVPISLIYKKDNKRNGNSPLLLYGYGAYGSTQNPDFYSQIFSLVDRGFVYAIAHVRGGGEMGRRWYREGKLLHKKNTFYDFIACAEHLIQEKYTSKEKLAIEGGSAGGLLIGAVLNMYPQLFCAAVAVVPFVDALNTMLDPSLPLTIREWDEWGNPKNKLYYEYIKSYAPYDNVEAKKYPHLLIKAGLHDTRVLYWEPAKWAAKLRALKTDSNLLLLKTDLEAGHGGPSGRYEYLRDIAFQYAFLIDISNKEAK